MVYASSKGVSLWAQYFFDAKAGCNNPLHNGEHDAILDSIVDIFLELKPR